MIHARLPSIAIKRSEVFRRISARRAALSGGTFTAQPACVQSLV